MWQERLCETHGGGVVGEQFLVENVDVDGSRVGEAESTLDSGIDEDAIQIRIFDDNFRGELGYLPSLSKIHR